MEEFSNNLQSPEAKEMLDKTPEWLLKYGNLAFIGVIVIFLTICVLIKYPDEIRCDALILTNPSIETIIAPRDGKITKLHKNEGNFVSKGEIIAEFSSDISYNSINVLDTAIQSLRKKLLLRNFAHLQSIDFFSNEQILSDKVLEINGLIYSLKKSLMNQKSGDVADDVYILKSSIKALQNLIENWRANNLLVAKSNGYMKFPIFLSTNETVYKGDIISFIVPDNIHYFSRIYIPTNIVNRIENDKVKIYVSRNNDKDYIKGTLVKVSLTPVNVNDDKIISSVYVGQVFISESEIKTAKDWLPLTNKLEAEAVLTTPDITLLERMWYKIKPKDGKS